MFKASHRANLNTRSRLLHPTQNWPSSTWLNFDYPCSSRYLQGCLHVDEEDKKCSSQQVLSNPLLGPIWGCYKHPSLRHKIGLFLSLWRQRQQPPRRTLLTHRKVADYIGLFGQKRFYYFRLCVIILTHLGTFKVWSRRRRRPKNESETEVLLSTVKPSLRADLKRLSERAFFGLHLRRLKFEGHEIGKDNDTKAKVIKSFLTKKTNIIRYFSVC